MKNRKLLAVEILRNPAFRDCRARQSSGGCLGARYEKRVERHGSGRG